MNDPRDWSLDRDPPRDEVLARLLRAADGAGPEAGVDWERLRWSIAAASAAAGPRAGEWWDVVGQWRRVATAAAVAAVVASAAAWWQADEPGVDDLALAAAAPESAALVRVVAAYPDEIVLSSMLESDRDDEFTSWEIQ